MSLRVKFSLLLGVMGLAIVAIVATSVGAFTYAANTLEAPFRVAVQSLAALDELDRALRARRDALLVQSATGQSQEEGEAALADAERRARSAIASLDSMQRRSGALLAVEASDVSAVERRIGELFSLSRTALDNDQPLAASASRLEAELAGYIERMRLRVASNADAAGNLASALQRWLLAGLLLEVVSAAIVAYLVLRFLNKWIVRPVNQLREAAERIGAGDFSHRVPVGGDDEVARLGGEVNQMAGLVSRMQEERARDARLAALGEMSRAIAHNIRNPLAGIRALAELTRAELNGERELAAYQSRIVDTVDRFDSWLKEMIRASGPATAHGLQEEDVGAWLTRVVQARRSAADTANVRIELDVSSAPARARIDAARLEHAVEAIVSNALDVTSAGGAVRCAAGVDPGGATWFIRVEDEGPGMPIAVRERLFDYGFTTKPDGSGVGLALALQIVRAHGGSIEVEDARDEGPDRGAAFTIRLPSLSRVAEEGSGGQARGASTR